MNCLRFRQLCLTDPRCADQEFDTHRAQCAECQAFRARLKAIDDDLKDTLEVDVPEDLRARIMLKQAIERERYRRHNLMALAASLLIIIGGGLLWGLPYLGDHREALSFQTAAVEYIHSRPELLTVEDLDAPADFNRMISDIGARMISTPAGIRVAEFCRVQDRTAAHWILDGEAGPVSVIYTRDVSPIARRRSHDRGGDYTTLLAPIGQGAVVLVGETGENLDAMIERIGSSVAW